METKLSYHKLDGIWSLGLISHMEPGNLKLPQNLCKYYFVGLMCYPGVGGWRLPKGEDISDFSFRLLTNGSFAHFYLFASQRSQLSAVTGLPVTSPREGNRAC